MNQIAEINYTIPQTSDVISDVREILRTARLHAFRTLNTDMVMAYWLIGKRIVIEEQGGESKAKYGERLLQQLSKSLEAEFGNGFSYANLRNMRQFYMTFDEQICYTLCINLSWSHNRLIMRIEDPKAREWYLKEAAAQQWSVRQLERNIRSLYYQRLINTKAVEHREAVEVRGNVKVKQFIKDPYVLEFVGLPPFPYHKEKPLEDALMDNMQNFLLELGKGFSFIQRQYRISTETEHFYIDSVFYNYVLKCFVLIDLKTTKLTHRDVGQMDMYIRMFDDIKRGEGDNPTIGILLCADKDETIVKYSVLSDSQQMFASKYLPYMPTEEELKQEIEKSRQIDNK